MDLLERAKQNLEEVKKIAKDKNTSEIKKKSKIEKKESLSSMNLEDLELLTMDQVRGLYIWIVKKTPKHDSKHTKNFLIDSIIDVFNKSKKMESD